MISSTTIQAIITVRLHHHLLDLIIIIITVLVLIMVLIMVLVLVLVLTVLADIMARVDIMVLHRLVLVDMLQADITVLVDTVAEVMDLVDTVAEVTVQWLFLLDLVLDQAVVITDIDTVLFSLFV